MTTKATATIERMALRDVCLALVALLAISCTSQAAEAYVPQRYYFPPGGCFGVELSDSRYQLASGDVLEPLPPVEPDEQSLRDFRGIVIPQYGPGSYSPELLGTANIPADPAAANTPPESAAPSIPKGPGLGGPAFGSSGKSPFRLGGYFAPASQVSGQMGDLTMSGQQLDAALPIFVMPEERGMWLGMFNFEHLQLSTSAVLPDTNVGVPNDLWNLSWGIMHFRKLDNGNQIGGMVSVGTASDRPFAAVRDMTFTTLGFMNVPARNERDAWNFSVFYSPTSQIPFPVPGVAYAWRPSPQFQANIGVPFSFTYLPTTTCTVAGSYMPLTNVRLSVRQQIAEAWFVCSGYQSVTQTYFLANRADDQERFYVFDQRLYLAIERNLGRGFVLDLTTAYLFDRQLFQATSFTADRSDVLRIGAGLGTSLNVSWRR